MTTYDDRPLLPATPRLSRDQPRSTIRYLACDHCEQEHVAYPTCDACRGRGHVIGGDTYHPCPACRLRYQDYVAHLDAVDRELQRAKEAYR